MARSGAEQHDKQQDRTDTDRISKEQNRTNKEQNKSEGLNGNDVR